MNSVTLKENISPRDTFLVNSILGLGVTVQNHVAYVKTTRKELAREAKVSTKTITRKIQKFGDVGLISFEHKLGAKGGIIIKLNPDKFSFGDLKSPLTNPTKSETRLIDRLFPVYKRTKAIRRTKSEMAEYNQLRSKFSKRVKDANNEIINNYLDKKDLDWSFFDGIGDEGHSYQVWLLSRAYDAMVSTYEKQYVDDYNDPDNHQLYGYAKRKHGSNYRSLDGAFIGSYNYKSFERLIEFSDSIGFNPVIVMGKVFERYVYTHKMYNRKAKIPVPNQLIDKNGTRIVKEAIENQKKVNKFNGTLSTDFKNSPELMAIYKVYTNYAYHKETKPVSTLSMIKNDFGTGSLYHYYTQAMYNVNTILTDDEVRAVDFYLRQQIGMMVDHQATVAISSEVPSLSIRIASEQLPDSSKDELTELITTSMGALSGGKLQFPWFENAIETVLSGHNIAQETYRVEFERYGMFYSIQKIASALNKVKNYVPVSPVGSLIRKDVLTGF